MHLFTPYRHQEGVAIVSNGVTGETGKARTGDGARSKGVAEGKRGLGIIYLFFSLDAMSLI